MATLFHSAFALVVALAAASLVTSALAPISTALHLAAA
jgi:hypothetical protein